MDVVGLGTAACNIADHFSRYPQYTVHKIDVGIEGDRCFSVSEQRNAEDYESNVPVMSDFFSDLGDEVLFIVAGSGNISGMSLRVLEQIKDKRITILYISPNKKTLTGKKKLLERATFGILQEYSRSGLLEEIIIVSNEKVAEIVGDLPVIGYYRKINELIVSTLHFINIFNRTEHVYGVVEDKDDVCAITTIGILDPETSKEQMLFDLDLIREKDYQYALRNSVLMSESKVIPTIEGHMEEKTETWLTKISYRIYSTEYETDYGYVMYRTSKVQGE